MSSTTQTITQVLKIKKYLKDIGITEPFRKRIEDIHSHIQRIIPCKVKDIFISDYIREDGTHVYEDLDFYTDDYIITASSFVERLAIAIGCIKRHIVYISFQTRDYDFKKANEKSRLNITAEYDIYPLKARFRATGRNCDYLMEYVREYFIPNLRD